jgi:hypothetical protein
MQEYLGELRENGHTHETRRLRVTEPPGKGEAGDQQQNRQSDQNSLKGFLILNQIA